MAVLKAHILALPAKICAELRGALDQNQLHAVRLCVESVVDKALSTLSDTLVQMFSAKEFIAQLAADDNDADTKNEDIRARKKAAMNAKRRKKRHAKQARI